MAQKKGGGGKDQSYDEATGRYESKFATPAELLRLKQLGIELNKNNLTSRDWARIYKRLGEAKIGGYIETLPNGDKIIPLHKMSDNDVPKIVILSGTFESPKLKISLFFEDKEEMFERLGRMKHEIK